MISARDGDGLGVITTMYEFVDPLDIGGVKYNDPIAEQLAKETELADGGWINQPLSSIDKE